MVVTVVTIKTLLISMLSTTAGSATSVILYKSYHADNLEKSDLTADGQLSFDSSQGLIVIEHKVPELQRLF